MTGSQFVVSVVGAAGSCFGLLLLLYNVLSFALFLRESTEGSSSGLARASWAAGILALFLWWLPCGGALIALVAIGTSRMERGRIFRDESPLAGVTPIRLGSMNGVLVLGLQTVLILATLGVLVSNALG